LIYRKKGYYPQNRCDVRYKKH